LFFQIAKAKAASKTKEEQIKEKRQELEKKLQDVTGQLGGPAPTPVKKGAPKKGIYFVTSLSSHPSTFKHFSKSPFALFLSVSFNQSVTLSSLSLSISLLEVVVSFVHPNPTRFSSFTCF
jgi:hypothetical protein